MANYYIPLTGRNEGTKAIITGCPGLSRCVCVCVCVWLCVCTCVCVCVSEKGGKGGRRFSLLTIPPGAPTEGHISLYLNFRICLPKKIPTFFSIPQKNPDTSSKLRLCYCWFELMKSTIPKIFPASFIDPKKRSLLAKYFRPKKWSKKIYEWGLWDYSGRNFEQRQSRFVAV